MAGKGINWLGIVTGSESELFHELKVGSFLGAFDSIPMPA